MPNPGKIINRYFPNIFFISCLFRNLIKEEHLNAENIKYCRFVLKENLLEHHDYEAITKNVFKYLKKWYDVDYEIIRFLKKDPFNENKLALELHIGMFLILIISK